MPDIGKKLPPLKGSTGDGSELKLSSLKGRWVVVYFYPKDNTPGCTNEAKDFRDLHPAFLKRHAQVVGVSRDSVKSHANFAAKQFACERDRRKARHLRAVIVAGYEPPRPAGR